MRRFFVILLLCCGLAISGSFAQIGDMRVKNTKVAGVEAEKTARKYIQQGWTIEDGDMIEMLTQAFIKKHEKTEDGAGYYYCAQGSSTKQPDQAARKKLTAQLMRDVKKQVLDKAQGVGVDAEQLEQVFLDKELRLKIAQQLEPVSVDCKLSRTISGSIREESIFLSCPADKAVEFAKYLISEHISEKLGLQAEVMAQLGF